MKNEHTAATPTEATPAKAPEAVATSSPTPATKKAPSTKKKSPPKKRAAEPRSVRPGTKKDAILTLLKRPKGATLKELRKATGWQAHSVRGFLSGVLKKMGLKLKLLDRDGARAYQLKS